MIVTISNADDVLIWGAKGEERIIQNARNILRTRRFEVPFMRGMGINPDFPDASINQIKTAIATDVINALNAYESRVNVLEVDVASVDENGSCVITVKLEV